MRRWCWFVLLLSALVAAGVAGPSRSSGNEAVRCAEEFRAREGLRAFDEILARDYETRKELDDAVKRLRYLLTGQAGKASVDVFSPPKPEPTKLNLGLSAQPKLKGRHAPTQSLLEQVQGRRALSLRELVMGKGGTGTMVDAETPATTTSTLRKLAGLLRSMRSRLSATSDLNNVTAKEEQVQSLLGGHVPKAVSPSP